MLRRACNLDRATTIRPDHLSPYSPLIPHYRDLSTRGGPGSRLPLISTGGVVGFPPSLSPIPTCLSLVGLAGIEPATLSFAHEACDARTRDIKKAGHNASLTCTFLVGLLRLELRTSALSGLVKASS